MRPKGVAADQPLPTYPDAVHRWHPTLLKAVARRVKPADLDRHIAELAAVGDRCHISRVKAAFLRRVRALHPTA